MTRTTAVNRSLGRPDAGWISRVRGDPAGRHFAGGGVDEEHHVEPAQQGGVDVSEVAGDRGLGSQQLRPGRRTAGGCGEGRTRLRRAGCGPIRSASEGRSGGGAQPAGGAARRSRDPWRHPSGRARAAGRPGPTLPRRRRRAASDRRRTHDGMTTADVRRLPRRVRAGVRRPWGPCGSRGCANRGR